MIVYKENIIVQEYPKKRTCKKCQSVLGIEEKDIIKIHEYDQREGTYTLNGFNCPVCKTEQEL